MKMENNPPCTHGGRGAFAPSPRANCKLSPRLERIQKENIKRGRVVYRGKELVHILNNPVVCFSLLSNNADKRINGWWPVSQARNKPTLPYPTDNNVYDIHIQAAIDLLGPCLAHICGLRTSPSYLTKDFHTAKIIMRHQSRHTNRRSSYRLISILLALPKGFEQITAFTFTSINIEPCSGLAVRVPRTRLELVRLVQKESLIRAIENRLLTLVFFLL